MESNDLIIKNLLQQTANDRIEIKTNATLDAIAKTITAFINGRGGDLLLGVDENKKILGLDNAQQYTIEILDYLTKNIVPTAPVSVNLIHYNSKPLILIGVWEGANKPYSYRLKIYNRSNGRNIIAGNRVVTQLIENRKAADSNWERMSALAVELSDLDLYEIKKTIDIVIEGNPDKKFADEEDFLIQHGLMLNGNLTNAGVLLFGKNPARFIPQSKIRLTVYPDRKSTNVFLEDKYFDGHIFSNITNIFNYLDALFGKTIRVDGLLRTEKKNYPELALREGILNAIVHRDYHSFKGFMHISAYADRTEISNYGGLPDGISIADLKKEHPSILRNPDIANICFVRKYIEMAGSGSIRMLADCKKNGFKMPVWKEANNILTLTFPDVFHAKSEGASEGANLDIEGISGNVKVELLKIYSFIKENPSAKVSDIQTYINKSNATVERYLKILKDNRLISFIGSRNNKIGGYKIVDTANDVHNSETC
ncbi:MAG: putative DNA binding domain-containing protein [Bacteroidales bacterium]|jgi:ATP-dependent DNA helicase RecG|nr:putative DNA binding domain-containing protein [Bacteroidales bacterium]